MYSKTRNFNREIVESVEFWILFHRNKQCWSLAPKANIYITAYLCGDSYCQSLMVVVNKNKKNKPFFHVNSVKKFLLFCPSAWPPLSCGRKKSNQYFA